MSDPNTNLNPTVEGVIGNDYVQSSDELPAVVQAGGGFPLTIPLIAKLHPNANPVFNTLKELVEYLCQVCTSAAEFEACYENLHLERVKLLADHVRLKDKYDDAMLKISEMELAQAKATSLLTESVIGKPSGPRRGDRLTDGMAFSSGASLTGGNGADRAARVHFSQSHHGQESLQMNSAHRSVAPYAGGRVTDGMAFNSGVSLTGGNGADRTARVHFSQSHHVQDSIHMNSTPLNHSVAPYTDGRVTGGTSVTSGASILGGNDHDRLARVHPSQYGGDVPAPQGSPPASMSTNNGSVSHSGVTGLGHGQSLTVPDPRTMSGFVRPEMVRPDIFRVADREARLRHGREVFMDMIRARAALSAPPSPSAPVVPLTQDYTYADFSHVGSHHMGGSGYHRSGGSMSYLVPDSPGDMDSGIDRDNSIDDIIHGIGEIKRFGADVEEPFAGHD